MARWQSFDEIRGEMERMQNEMNRLFSRYGWGDGGSAEVATSYPALDVWEEENSLFVEAELPGMALNDLEIYVTGGDQLTIKGERRQPEAEQGTWQRQERGFGTFHRVFTLPIPVDEDKVEARLAHGVLTIELPKREEAKPRRIQVKAE